MGVYASCFGSAKIVDSFLTGKGASFGLKLKSNVKISISDSEEYGKEMKVKNHFSSLHSAQSPLCDHSTHSARSKLFYCKEDIPYITIKNEAEIDPDIVNCIKACVTKTFERFGFCFGVEVEFSSEIPKSLGNKCAIINSTVLASLGLITKKYGRIQNACIFKDLRTDKFSKDKVMEIEGRIISDSEILGISKDVIKELNLSSECPLEDLHASYFGGFFAADNKENKILRFGENENLKLMILNLDKLDKPDKPDKSDKPDNLDKLKTAVNMNTLKNEADIAFNEALKGNLYTSMNLSALIYSTVYSGIYGENKRNFEVIKSALDSGAISCSLSGNVFSAVFRDDGVKEKIRENWKVFGGVLIESESNNEKAKLTEI